MDTNTQGAANAASTKCEVCQREDISFDADRILHGECWRKEDGEDGQCYRLGYERLLAILEQYPCPHSRPSWRMCPHCLGINQPVPSGSWVVDAPKEPSL